MEKREREREKCKTYPIFLWFFFLGVCVWGRVGGENNDLCSSVPLPDKIFFGPPRSQCVPTNTDDLSVLLYHAGYADRYLDATSSAPRQHWSGCCVLVGTYTKLRK